MGVLLLQFQKMNLLQEQNNIQYQILNLNNERNDYTKYGEIMSNDSLTMADMAAIPASLFASGMGSISMMHSEATQYAQNTMQSMMQNGIFNQYGNNSPQMQQIAYMKAYEQAKEQIKKRIQIMLNEREKKMDMKKARLESRLTAIEAELSAIAQRLGKAIENAVGKFTLS